MRKTGHKAPSEFQSPAAKGRMHVAPGGHAAYQLAFWQGKTTPAGPNREPKHSLLSLRVQARAWEEYMVSAKHTFASEFFKTN